MFRRFEPGKKARKLFDKENLHSDIWERKDALREMLKSRKTKDLHNNFFSLDSNRIAVEGVISFYQDKGRKVTKESLGIKKGDSSETMMDKLIKGMRPGDYIDGGDLDFLNSNIGIILDKATMQSEGILILDRTFAGRMAGVGSDAKLIIKAKVLNKMSGYDFKLTGVKTNQIYTSGFINDNKLYFYDKGKLFSVPIK